MPQPPKPRRRRTLNRTLRAGLAALAVGGCAVTAPLPEPVDLERRLASFPSQGLALERPVTIRWNQHLVPYIEAETDGDAAYALGLTHAHLRLGQMAIYKRVAQGRLAEMAGPVPIAIDIDKALRTLGFGRAAPEILAAMPADTRAWVERYVEGINDYQRLMDEPPHEFEVLGLEREPWTAEDVVSIGRVSGTDITWLVYFSLLPLRDTDNWSEIWDTALALGGAGTTSLETAAATGSGDPPTDGEARVAALLQALEGMGRTGSNSVAVAAERSATGGALIANDPHLGLSLPNIWVLAGLRSPSYHVVGMTAPGLPIFTVGRNPDIAWGGTNMRAASSDLVDISDRPESTLTTETDPIGVRFWLDTEVEYRLSEFGPVISDAPLVPDMGGRTVALKWMGHLVSDELTALLRASRAHDWEGFRRAFATFALPAQNMLYADREGGIGILLAARVPRRPNGPPEDIFRQPTAVEESWDELLTALELPYQVNPEQGYLASANNRPAVLDPRLGYFYSPPERVDRLHALLAAEPRVGVEDLMALQRDVYSGGSVALRDSLVARVDAAAAGTDIELSPGAAEALATIRGWDGHYRADSRGGLAFQAMFAGLAPALYEAAGRADLFAWLDRSSYLTEHMAGLLEDIDDAVLLPAVAAALDEAGTVLAEHGTWGAIHRVRLQHPLANLPVIGGRYRFGDFAAGGSVQTVMKTAHPLTTEVHRAFYGSQSRHVSDLSDPDANWFVLLGGQDGRINSPAFTDQVDLWRQGRYIRMPLTEAAVAEAFSHRMVLDGPQA